MKEARRNRAELALNVLNLIENSCKALEIGKYVVEIDG